MVSQAKSRLKSMRRPEVKAAIENLGWRDGQAVAEISGGSRKS
jgi:hypothetical protein